MPEHNNRKTVYAPAHTRIRYHFRSLVWAGIIVKPDQLHVIRAFTRCYVCLQNKPVKRNIACLQLIVISMAGCHLKSLFELHVVVLSGIRSRGSTLHVDLASRKCEVF